ncbi:MAG: hypothetical protein HGA31_03585 [Candidatus Moranbacteria bacterium]|nr:hypothetical protein [Candidatus Moranbacteria bacterium]
MKPDYTTIAACITAVLLLVSSFVYARRTVRGEIDPVPATWVLMMVFLGLSCFMYWNSPRKSFTGNIALTAGLVNISVIVVGVLYAKRNDAVLFDSYQRLCLWLSGIIVIFWAITGDQLVSYILLQLVALIAYSATVKKLLTAKEVREPLFIWVSVLLAAIIAVYPAIVRQDIYGYIYIARAVPSTIGIIWLILRVRQKKIISTKTETA